MSSELPKVFGFSTSADLSLASLAFLVIVVYIVIADHSLDSLDNLFKDTAYQPIIRSTYKELLIMGISSCGLSIYLAIAGASTWLQYLEIADITLFFSAVYHAFFSLAFIATNVLYIRLLRVHLSMKVQNLLQRYQETTRSGILGSSRFNLFDTIETAVELRVLRIWFLQQFNLSGDFDFARYLILAQEKNAVEMLEVTIWQRLVILLFVALNIGREKLGITAAIRRAHEIALRKECNSYKSSDEGTESCFEATVVMLLFGYPLLVFLLFNIILAFVSRLYIKRILKTATVDAQSYSRFILDDEARDIQESRNSTQTRMNWEKLRDTIDKAKQFKVADRWNGKRRKRLSSHHDGDDSSASLCFEKIASNSKYFCELLCSKVETKDDDFRNRHQSVIAASSFNDDGPASAKQTLSQKMAASRLNRMVHAGIHDGIFLFNRSDLFFSSRNMGNMLFSLCLSVYSTGIIAVSIKTKHTVMWNVLFLFIFIVCRALLYYTTRMSGILYAVTKLDMEVVEKVLEEQEEANLLEKSIREKLLNKIKNAVGDDCNSCETALLQLFNEIQSLDGLDDGMISPNELKHLLRRLNIHFSNKSFEDAFAIIDTNCDGFVSLMEFHAFIFPKEAAVKQLDTRWKELQRLDADSSTNSVMCATSGQEMNAAADSIGSRATVTITGLVRARRTAVTMHKKAVTVPEHQEVGRHDEDINAEESIPATQNTHPVASRPKQPSPNFDFQLKEYLSDSFND